MIPLIIAGAGALIGLGAHACASVDNSEAKEKNEQANEIIEEASKLANDAKQMCQGSIDVLAKEKTAILQGNMKRFVRSFSRIKAVNFNDTGDLFEMAKFNKNELVIMQSMVSSMHNVTMNDVAGGASGVALAIGAVDMMAGGTLLSSISGATLGVVAAPVFAITGIFSASEAAANLEKAKSNLAKARAYQDECETYSYLAAAVSERCDLFYEVLHDLNLTWFTDAVNQLEMLVNSKNTFENFVKNIIGKKVYTRQEMQTVASAAALAKMVKTIIDTKILDNEGYVTDESERVILAIQDRLDSGELLVKNAEPLYQQPQYQQQVGYQQYQQQVVQQMKAGVQQIKKELIYQPNIFVGLIMWGLTVLFAGMGALIVLGGGFLCGVIWIAAGIVMCPKTNINMKFGSRLGLMFLLFIIGCFLI